MVGTLNTAGKTKKKKLDRGSNIFYALLMIFPVAQFILFYIVVNFKSFGYAFMEQTKISDTEVTWRFTFDNITKWFSNDYSRKMLFSTAKMSILYYAVVFLISIPLGLLFSYYIFKKLPMSKLFRVFLFIPSIIPAAAFVLSYKIIFNDVIDVVVNNLAENFPKLKDVRLRFDNHPFAYILFYNLYISFGTAVLMYANKMFDISPEIIEAGKLDGAVGIKEFWHIVLPLVFPTLSVFLVTGVAIIFTNHYNLYLFHVGPKYDTLGYYLYKLAGGTVASEQAVPEVAALGLILTVVAIPLTFGVKALLDKFGPSED